MTGIGWMLVLIPVVVVGLIVWGVREDPDPPRPPAVYDWQDDPLDFTGPMP